MTDNKTIEQMKPTSEQMMPTIEDMTPEETADWLEIHARVSNAHYDSCRLMERASILLRQLARADLKGDRA